MPEEEPAPVIPEKIEASYTQEQLDAAVRSAEERGFESGFKAASGNSEKKQLELLDNLNNRIITLLSETGQIRSEAAQESLQVALEVVQKILPSLEREQAQREVENFLTENFPNFSREQALSFSFNPEMAAAFPELISKLADRNDFEGRIAVHKDPALGLSDCRVEWQNGGVERNTHKMLEKVSNMLDDIKSEN